MKKNGKSTGEKEKKHKWKKFPNALKIIVYATTMFFALVLYVLFAILIPENNSFDIKSNKALKIFLLATVILCTTFGFLVGFGVVPMESGNLSLTICGSSLIFALVSLYWFSKMTNLSINYLLILILIFIINWCKVEITQQIRETNDSMRIKGGVEIAARITDESASIRFPTFTYKFMVNDDVFSRRQMVGLKNRKVGDTILIVYSVDNPKLSYPVEFYPSREQIEKYKYGRYFKMKKKEK